jgi:hypothetical protein
VYVVPESGWPAHVALDKANLACAVRKEVGMAMLKADVDAREFFTVDSV